MKRLLGIVVLISFSTHGMSIELNDIKNHAIWKHGKQIIMDHGEKIIGVVGILSAIVFVHCLYSYRMERAKVQDLYAIIMRKNMQAVKEGMETFLDGNKKIDVDLILTNKIHICWHKPEDYGSKALDTLHKLLRSCKKKHQCINIETHFINEQLECVIVDKQVS